MALAPEYPQQPPTWIPDLGALDLCPYYIATHLSGVKVAPSPAWLQEAIAAAGHRPINNVVDITNFILFEMGQPLHAFDAAQTQWADDCGAPRARG